MDITPNGNLASGVILINRLTACICKPDKNEILTNFDDLLAALPSLLSKDPKRGGNKEAKTKHIMPARLTNKNYNRVLKIAKKTHKVLNCRGVTRSDFKFYKNIFYLLEINTQPGMTSLSLVPEIASYKGLNFDNLIEKILSDATINK